jgi:sugar/nucleoside kinase (ribokinase family)
VPARITGVNYRAVGVEHVTDGSDAATAATTDGVVCIPTLPVGTPVRDTGGDRFTAGLAMGLTTRWGLPVALGLGLGNALAGAYVATGETPDRAGLRVRPRDALG